jgi:hypothetical protein
MRAILEFNLEDIDDKSAFRRASHADDAYSALWEIQELIRRAIKDDRADIDNIGSEIFDIISDHVNMNDYQ